MVHHTISIFFYQKKNVKFRDHALKIQAKRLIRGRCLGDRPLGGLGVNPQASDERKERVSFIS